MSTYPVWPRPVLREKFCDFIDSKVTGQETYITIENVGNDLKVFV